MGNGITSRNFSRGIQHCGKCLLLTQVGRKGHEQLGPHRELVQSLGVSNSRLDWTNASIIAVSWDEKSIGGELVWYTGISPRTLLMRRTSLHTAIWLLYSTECVSQLAPRHGRSISSRVVEDSSGGWEGGRFSTRFETTYVRKTLCTLLSKKLSWNCLT
eukprot:302057-Amphidinium_carterae.1